MHRSAAGAIPVRIALRGMGARAVLPALRILVRLLLMLVLLVLGLIISRMLALMRVRTLIRGFRRFLTLRSVAAPVLRVDGRHQQRCAS